MGRLLSFRVRINRVGMSVGEVCLGCWSPVTEFENAGGVACGWCQCEWPEDETQMEIVQTAADQRLKPN